MPSFPTGLTFAGNTRLANSNNLTDITTSSITFDAAAVAFVLGGNGITLNGNIDFNGNPSAPIIQTVNLNMARSASETIDTPTNGNLTLGGAITSSWDICEIAKSVVVLTAFRHVGLPKARVIRSDKMVSVGQQRNEITKHVAGAWKTVQEEQSWRTSLSSLTVEDFDAIDVSSAVIDVHNFI
jgi:hypothetical protein